MQISFLGPTFVIDIRSLLEEPVLLKIAFLATLLIRILVLSLNKKSCCKCGRAQAGTG